jgi:hypothetical protein
MKFSLNARVQVSQHYHWAQGATGIILDPPKSAREVARPKWDGITRTVQSLKGPQVFYWVQFDQLQKDADGDGPYNAGEIAETALALTV